MKLNTTPQEIYNPPGRPAGSFPVLFTSIAGVYIGKCPHSLQPRFTPGHAYTMNISFTRPGTRQMNLSTNGSALHFAAHPAQYHILNADPHSVEDDK